jgi:hypothetical protein
MNKPHYVLLRHDGVKIVRHGKTGYRTLEEAKAAAAKARSGVWASETPKQKTDRG